MSRSEMIQRFVNDQLQPLLASIDAVRPMAISLVQATFETKQRAEFDTATSSISQHLETATQKVDLLRNMVDQGEALHTHLGTIITTLAKLTKGCTTMFQETSTPEEQEVAMGEVNSAIQDLHSNFSGFDSVFSQPLTIKEGAVIPAQEQKVDKPSSRALRGVQSSRQIQTASSYMSQLGSDSFVTKDPTEWTDHDLRDFLRSWLQLEEPVVALFGQLDGPAFLALTREQIFQLAPSFQVENPADVAMSIAEALQDLTSSDTSTKCSIPEAELSFMNTGELVRRANGIAGDLAYEINRFTEGFLLIKPRPVPTPAPAEGEQAAQIQLPPEDPAVTQQNYITGKAICNDAITKFQQAFYDIVSISQAYVKKVEDSFLVQELLSQVNKFEVVSVQFQASIATLVNATGAADDAAILLQLQATANSFVASLTATLEELDRVQTELVAQIERNKKVDEDRKKLQAARRIRGRLTTPYIPPSADILGGSPQNPAQPVSFPQGGDYPPQEQGLMEQQVYQPPHASQDPAQLGFPPQQGSPQQGYPQQSYAQNTQLQGAAMPPQQAGFPPHQDAAVAPQQFGFPPQQDVAMPPGAAPASYSPALQAQYQQSFAGTPPSGFQAGPPGFPGQPAPQPQYSGFASPNSAAAAAMPPNFRPVSTPVGGIPPHHPPAGALQRTTSERGSWYGMDTSFQKFKPSSQQRPQSGRVRLASTRRGSGMFQPVNPDAAASAPTQPTAPPAAQNFPVGQPAVAPLSPQSRLSVAHSQLNLRMSVVMLPPEFAGNVWAEREYDPKQIILDGDGPDKDQLPIRAASLNQLIMRLTSVRVVDQNFMKTFLLTYSSFTSSEDVMLKLEERYFVPEGVPMADDQRRALQLKVINFLKKWIIERARDFNETLLHCVREFTESMKAEGQTPLAQQIESALQKLQSDAKRKNEELSHATNGLFLKMKNIGRKNESPQQFVLRVSAEKLAEHLSLLDMRIYRQIQPIELLGKAWSKSDGKKRSPNVMQLITRFNNVSSWVASCILWCEKVKDRTAMVKKFLKVMTHLDKTNNFNSLMAISAGLNNSAVHRLKFTMDDLPPAAKQEWTDLQDKMTTDNNSRLYRDRLHQATPPVMPYLGIYLTDITFIEDGNADDLTAENNKLINFRKRELVFRVIDEIQRYQQTPYKTEVDPSVLSAIQELPFNNDDELYALSLQREPRGTANRATIQ